MKEYRIITETAENLFKRIVNKVKKGETVEIVMQYGKFKKPNYKNTVIHRWFGGEPIKDKVVVYAILNGVRKHLYTVESYNRLTGIIHFLFHMDEATITKSDYVRYFNGRYRYSGDSKLTQLYINGALSKYPFLYMFDDIETYLDLNTQAADTFESVAQVYNMTGYNIVQTLSTPVCDKYILRKL